MARLEELACRQFVELVTEYSENLLGPRERQWFEEHAVACDGCARYLDQMRETAWLLDGLARGRQSPPTAKEPPPKTVGAYRFLRRDRVDPLTALRWPINQWVCGERSTDTRVRGCRSEHLPYWLSDELWQMELADPVEKSANKVLSPAGQLTAQITHWNAETAQTFAEDCATRVKSWLVHALERAGRDAITFRTRAEAEAAARTVKGMTVDEFTGTTGDELGDRLSLRRWPRGADPALQYTIAAAHECFEPRGGAVRAKPKPDAFQAAAGAAYVGALAAARYGSWKERALERRSQAQWLRDELHLT